MWDSSPPPLSLSPPQFTHTLIHTHSPHPISFSVTGKKLMAKCRSLMQENQELGKQISQGRVAQLEAEISLQRKFNEEIKASQDGGCCDNHLILHVSFDVSLLYSLPPSLPPSLSLFPLYLHPIELSEFVFQLDEEIEAMQATLLHLEHQVKSSNLKEPGHGQMALTSPSKGGGSRDRERERTARATPNGPLDTHNSTSNGSSLSSKVVSRSQTWGLASFDVS